MDEIDTVKIRTDLRKLLRRFKTCAPNQNTRNYFRLYTHGLISDPPPPPQKRRSHRPPSEGPAVIRPMVPRQTVLGSRLHAYETPKNHRAKSCKQALRRHYRPVLVETRQFRQKRHENTRHPAAILRHRRQAGELHSHCAVVIGCVDISLFRKSPSPPIGLRPRVCALCFVFFCDAYGKTVTGSDGIKQCDAIESCKF